MKFIKYKIFKFLIPVTFCSLLGLVACEEETEEAFTPERMFMPTGAISAASGETEVKLSWKESLYADANAATYTVEVANDTLFQTPVVYTTTTDTLAVTLTDENLTIKQKYFARVKTNALGNVPESKWVTSSGFSIRGEQIFSTILDSEIKDKSVVLRWRPTTGLTTIVLKPANGNATDIMLTATDIATNSKTLTGLTGSTAYTAEIYAGTKIKGTATFTTKVPSIFTVEISPTDDLVAVVANAANNDVIGLAPGTYDATAANILITAKHITLQSVSGNPNNTIVNFKEITLAETGAGVKLSGIKFDGAAVGADYFLNLVGTVASNGSAATFSTILVENCVVLNMDNCFIRADRGSAADDHKITSIKVNNSIAGNSATASTYIFFTLPKLQFNTLELINSTFYNIGRGFIAAGTALAVKPTILLDKITLNNFGSGGTTRNYTIFDGNTNPVDFTLRNSIIANAPISGQTLGAAAFRANGTGSTITITNNNMFKLTNGASPAVDLTFPTNASPANNKTIDLGWTGSTVDFTLPAGSELRTHSTSGGPIGDPRWTL